MSTRSSKKRTRVTGPLSSKRTKLSAPTTFGLISNKTEAKNHFAEYAPAQILSGDILIYPFGGIAQGVDDHQRIGKAVTQRYADVRWRAVSASGSTNLSYRVIIGVVKFGYQQDIDDPDFFLEGTTAAAGNILRPINGLSSKYAVILHDKIYHGVTPTTGGISGASNPFPTDQVVHVRVPYTAQQVYQGAGADTPNNFQYFIMVINAPMGSGLDFRYTTNNWFTDA